MNGFRFRLYVLGATIRSRDAERQLRRLCQMHLTDHDYDIEVVDVDVRPDLADGERIVATPTVDRLSPLPRVRLIGDMSSEAQLAAALGLPARREDE